MGKPILKIRDENGAQGPRGEKGADGAKWNYKHNNSV